MLSAAAGLALSGLTAWGVSSAVNAAVTASAVATASERVAELDSLHDAASARLAAVADQLDEEIGLAHDAVGAGSDLADAEAITALASAIDRAGIAVSDVNALATAPRDPIAVVTLKTLSAEARWYRIQAGALAIVRADIDEQREALAGAAAQLFESAVSGASAVDNEYWLGEVEPRRTLRIAQGDLAGAVLDSDGVAALTALGDAARALEASHAAELAGFGGRLDTKLAIARFANSIAGGVMLEFDWVPELGGHGLDGIMSATATVDYREPYGSSLTLTENIASGWGSDRAAAIVAHEVGHAITNKCRGIFESSGGDYEAFATAWAIGMGFTHSSNGSSVYGYPSDEVIAAAATCR